MDGHLLLSAVYAQDCPPAVRVHPACEVLRQVWVQQYYIQDGKVHFRDSENLPSSENLIRSPYDLEARFSCKRQTEWTGYKVHLTETCDEDRPHLITHVATTPATLPDGQMTEEIHRALEKKGLLPCEHLLDSAYLDAQHLVHSREEHGIELVGPVRFDTSWQARAQEGFDVSCFAIDWEGQKVTCPQGKLSQMWSDSHDSFNNPVIHVQFAKADCQACGCRQKCTRGKGPRTLRLRPQAQHDALQKARQQQTSSEFEQRYKARAGIEGTLSQGTRAFGMRRTRYVGLAKTHLQHLLTAAAVNLARYVAWVRETPRAKTRTSTFAALVPAV
jgi:transposase